MMAIYSYALLSLFIIHSNGACDPIENCPEPKNRNIICDYTNQELQDIRSDYEKIIECGRTHCIAPNAVYNLQYFLDGSGQALELSAEFLTDSWVIQDQVEKNIETIICGTETVGTGIIGRKDDLVEGISMEQQICWCESAYANLFTDLYFASGGFTIQTSVDACIKKVDDKILFKLSDIRHKYYDPYNWEPGLGVYGGPCGLAIPDKAAYCLEQAGMAKSFIMTGEWKDKRPYQYGEIYLEDTGIFGAKPGPRACNYRFKCHVEGVECNNNFNSPIADKGTDFLTSLIPIIGETKQLSQFFGAMKQFTTLPDDIKTSINKLQSYQPYLEKLQSFIQKKEYSESWSYFEGPTFTFGSNQCEDDSPDSPDSPESPESPDSDDDDPNED